MFQWTITITKAPLKITAVDKNKTYGQSDPTLTVTYNGFVFTDGPSVVNGLAVVRQPGENAGRLFVTASGSAGNYAITFVPGTFIINKAPLQVTVENKTKVYGQIDPTLTALYNGFVFNDTPSAIVGLTISRVAGEGVGNYVISAVGTSGNYSILLQQAASRPSPQSSLVCYTENKSKVYGHTDPALTALYSGFVF